jgi:site-specific DNA recombinase
MTDSKIKKAVIYCRVSSIKQTKVGDGLKSQEATCREFARQRGYEVVAVFSDDLSGKLLKRPGMKEMLAYLRARRREPHAVLIDDISRLARHIRTHFELRDAISRVGATLESPTMMFSDDDEPNFEEIVRAGLSHEQRRANAGQTKARMRARLLNGFWPFFAMPGYKFVRSPNRVKILVRDEPLASVLDEALEGYASGRFETQTDVQRFLDTQPCYPLNSHISRVTSLLTRPIYAGYLEYEPWGISLRKGVHEPLISFETYKKNQARLSGAANVPTRKNLNFDFPLRGFVVCGDCGGLLTACWSQGRSAKHPYYLCIKRGCPSYKKSIKRDVIEGQFRELLESLRPSPEFFQIAYEMFEEHWNWTCPDSVDSISS